MKRGEIYYTIAGDFVILVDKVFKNEVAIIIGFNERTIVVCKKWYVKKFFIKIGEL